MSLHAAGKWAVPIGDIAAWAAATHAMKQARRGVTSVEAVVGCGLIPAGFVLPARLLGYAAVVTDNLALIRGVVGPKANLQLRIFCSAPKIAGLGRQIVTEDSISIGVRTLAGLAGTLDLVGARKYVRSVLIDTASPTPEVPAEVVSSAIAILHAHPGFVPTMKAIEDFGQLSDNGADPTIYAIEHAAPSMFGDIDSRDILHITIAGGAERRFWPVRRVVAGAALRCGIQTTPALARIVTSIKRTWYSPLQDEPTLVKLATEPSQVSVELSMLGRTNTSLKVESVATTRVIPTVDHNHLAQIPFLFDDLNVAINFLSTGSFELGKNIGDFIARHKVR